QLLDLDRALGQRIGRVDAQVDEIGMGHGWEDSMRGGESSRQFPHALLLPLPLCGALHHPALALLPIESGYELAGSRDPAKKYLQDEKGGVVITSSQIVADGFGCAISQQKTGVVSKHRIADCGFNTDTGCASGENQSLDRTAPEHVVE